jgi:hypothetical protein
MDLKQRMQQLNEVVSQFITDCAEDSSVDVSLIRESLPPVWGNGRDVLCREVCLRRNQKTVNAPRSGGSYDARHGVETR